MGKRGKAGGWFTLDALDHLLVGHAELGLSLTQQRRQHTLHAVAVDHRA
jgi:hypothetical protein